MDVKRIVGFVLLGSTLGIVFFVFYVLLSATDDDVGEDTPTWWRGNSYAGLVVDIDETHVTLHTHAGDNIHFRLDGNTRFVLRGNTPVKPGIEVKVQFRTIRASDSTYMLARTVRVLRPETEGTSSGEPEPGATRAVRPSPSDRSAPSAAPPSAAPSNGIAPSAAPPSAAPSNGIAPSAAPPSAAPVAPSAAPPSAAPSAVASPAAR